MTSKARLISVGLIFPALLATALIAASGRGDASRQTFDTRHSAFTASSVQQFQEFPLYNLGESFDGNALRAILRRDTTTRVSGLTAVRDYVSFIYGECVPDGHGCAPPFEVQVWPACVRSPADYTLTPRGDPLPSEPVQIRGVPAAFYEEGRLEVYTGDVTIVLFGFGRNDLEEAAHALRPINSALGPVPFDADLPGPVSGAMDGNLSC